MNPLNVSRSLSYDISHDLCSTRASNTTSRYQLLSFNANFVDETCAFCLLVYAGSWKRPVVRCQELLMRGIRTIAPTKETAMSASEMKSFSINLTAGLCIAPSITSVITTYPNMSRTSGVAQQDSSSAAGIYVLLYSLARSLRYHRDCRSSMNACSVMCPNLPWRLIV